MADSGSPFNARTLAWGVPIVAISLIATLLATVLGPELFEPVDAAPSVYSRSALGHRAFRELLDELGIETEISRARSGEKARDEGILVIAEPRETLDEEGLLDYRFLRDLSSARVALVVLPKLRAIPNPSNRRHAGKIRKVSESEVIEILDQLTDWSDGDAGGWQVHRSPTPVLEWEGRFDIAPFLSSPRQLVSHPDLEPWLFTDGGTLIGELPGVGPQRRVIVVSDPDLISNHGLWPDDGANARLVIALIESLLPEGETVIFDETCHGSAVKGGFWREALRFPLVLIVVQCALLFGMVLWSALGRFGPPVEEQVGLEAGSRRLVDSTAELLRFGRHRGLVIRKYLRLAIDAACQGLHGPTTGTLSERAAWLAEREKSETESGITSLARRVHAVGGQGSAEEIRELALAIDRWRWEIVHGSEGDRSGR